MNRRRKDFQPAGRVRERCGSKLDDPNTAHELGAIAEGATPSDQMNPRQRRAEIVQMLEVEISAGAEPLRITAARERYGQVGPYHNRNGVILAAVIAALGAVLVAFLKGWLSGE